MCADAAKVINEGDHDSQQGISNLLHQVVSRDLVVLDLGSFASGTTQAFLKRKCQCFVEDLPELLANRPDMSDAEFSQALSHHLIVLKHQVKIDLILAWDLFHYLSLTDIKLLIDILRPQFHQGTSIHATRHTAQNIPAMPQLFKLHENLSYQILESGNHETKPNQSHTTIDLLTQMQEFSLHDTLSHKHQQHRGMVEYLLRHGQKATQSPKRPRIIPDYSEKSARNYRAIKLPGLTQIIKSTKANSTSHIFESCRQEDNSQQALKQLSNTYTQEDLYTAMTLRQKAAIVRRFSLGSQILLYPAKTRFDLCLLWDSACFWAPDEFTLLLKRLKLYLNVGAKLHMVLPHGGKISSEACRFNLQPDSQTEVSGELTGGHDMPIASTSELVRLMTGFKVSKYYFGTLKSQLHYQEYVFEYLG